MCPTSEYPLAEMGSTDRLGIDANGCLTRLTHIDGNPVLIHYDDVPESDMETVRGVRTTTPLRTVIDLAAQLSDLDLENLVDDAMDHGLFTREEAVRRVTQPDMANRRGAQVLRELFEARRP